MQLEERRIGIVGAGNMGQALIAGLVAAGRIEPRRITAADPLPAAREAVAASGVCAVRDPARAVTGHDVVILTIKPQVAAQVLPGLADCLTQAQLLVSCMAGIGTGVLEGQIRSQIPVVRAMPQTLVRLRAGATALCAGTMAGAEHVALARELFDQVGTTVVVAEQLMDAVTGLAGSGPAYAYTVLQALTDGGVRMGLPREIARTLAAQTLLGAARMVLEGNQHPAVLRDQVTSPGGTTIAGLYELEAGGLGASIMRAVAAATVRSKELGAG